MSEPSRFKQIILIVLPLLLVVLGVLYYQDILAFVRPEKSLSDDTLTWNQFVSGSGTNSESGEDGTSGSSSGSAISLSVQQPVSDGTGQVGEVSSTGGSQMTQAADTFPALLPGGGRDLVTETEAIFTFLPSSLQNLRDPFQNLQKQMEMSAQSTAESSPTTDKVRNDSISVASGKTKIMEQDVTYGDLITAQYAFEQQANTSGTPNQFEQSPVKPVIQYPPFGLKGLVSQGGRQKAILAVKEQSYIVTSGDYVQDWFVKEITQNAVLVTNQDRQCFRITLEGVTLDEEINKGTKE